MFNILVVEDDFHLRKILIENIKSEGYNVLSAVDGLKGYEAFLNNHIDLVITDVMMPHMDGNSLISSIREINQNIPIIILSALDTFEDKERGFTRGVDDYLVKPINMQELHLRIKALLRRYQSTSESKLTISNTVLDYKSKTCTVNNELIELTIKEFNLLFKLLSSPNQIFTRSQLMNEIWGYDSDSYERTVDTHIKVLRNKIKSKDFDLLTVRGIGYKGVILWNFPQKY